MTALGGWLTPADTVVAGLTDADLRSGRGYERSVADLLLTLPAEYRQPVEAEVTRRSTRTVARTAGRDRREHQLESELVADPLTVRREVVAEAHRLLGGAS